MSMLPGKDFKSFHSWLILEQTGSLYFGYCEWDRLRFGGTEIMFPLSYTCWEASISSGTLRAKVNKPIKSKIEWRENRRTLSDKDGKINLPCDRILNCLQSLSPLLFLVPKQFYPFCFFAFPSCGVYKKQHVFNQHILFTYHTVAQSTEVNDGR